MTRPPVGPRNASGVRFIPNSLTMLSQFPHSFILKKRHHQTIYFHFTYVYVKLRGNCLSCHQCRKLVLCQCKLVVSRFYRWRFTVYLAVMDPSIMKVVDEDSFHATCEDFVHIVDNERAVLKRMSSVAVGGSPMSFILLRWK